MTFFFHSLILSRTFNFICMNTIAQFSPFFTFSSILQAKLMHKHKKMNKTITSEEKNTRLINKKNANKNCLAGEIQLRWNKNHSFFFFFLSDFLSIERNIALFIFVEKFADIKAMKFIKESLNSKESMKNCTIFTLTLRQLSTQKQKSQ